MTFENNSWRTLTGSTAYFPPANAGYQLIVEPAFPVVKIGIAGWGSNPEFRRSIDGFKESLAAKGYIEGENVEFITLNSETDLAVQRQIIERFVAQEVDLIYTLTTFGTLTAMSVTKEIPIVFSVVTYPVESNVIASLASSGNSVVGTRNYIPPSRQFFEVADVRCHLAQPLRSFQFL